MTYVSAEFDLTDLPGRDDWDPVESRSRGAIIGSRPVPQPGHSQISGWIIRLRGDRSTPDVLFFWLWLSN